MVLLLLSSVVTLIVYLVVMVLVQLDPFKKFFNHVDTHAVTGHNSVGLACVQKVI